MRVAILTTHPIQYQVPWFRLLAETEGIDLMVFFCMLPNDAQQGVGFGVAFQWDIPLLEGFQYRVLKNVAKVPSVTSFKGCDSPEVYDVLKTEKYDALIVNGWIVKSCIQALWACRRLDIPCIVRGESNAFRPRKFWKWHLHCVLLKQYAAFLAIGRSNRKFYLDHKVSSQRIFMTPYCVDNAFFAEHAAYFRSQRTRYRTEWGIPEDATVFLFVGKFEIKKRPMDVLEAFRSRPTSAHLLMVGSGELLEKCRQFAADLCLPVSFAGFMNQKEIPRAYAVADVMILPSDHRETWGLVVNEAMACGLPAVVSDQVGCHPDLIVNGETGYTFELGDTDTLADIVGSLAANDAELCRMGEQASKRVASYNFEKVAAGVLQALGVCVGSTDALATVAEN